MSSDWSVVRIDQIKEDGKGSIAIGPFGSRMKSDCYVEHGVPVIRGKNLGESPEFINDFVYVTQEKADDLGACNVYKGDLVFPHRGSIGEVGIIESDSRYILSSSLMKLRCNREKANPKYIYYFFKSHTGRHELLKNSSQVGTPGIGQPLSSLKSIELSLPPLKVQDGIVKTLEHLDKKIELNHRINQTLEQMAQALFKSWFVDFDPVKAKVAALEAGGSEDDALLAAMREVSGKTADQLATLSTEKPERYAELCNTATLFPTAMQESELGEIPEGWWVAPFSEITRLDTKSIKPANEPEKVWEHYSIPAFDEGKTPALELGASIKSSKYKVSPTAILVSKLNPHFPRTWWPDVNDEGAAICSTEFMQFIPRKPKLQPFIAGIVTSEPFQSGIMMRVTGSTGSRQRAQPKQVAGMDVVLPPENLMEAYSNLTSGMYLEQLRNIKQSQTLATLRDTLLPKLLSGELTVLEAEEAQAESQDVAHV